MTRLNQIEEGLRQIESGRFQKLATEYLCRKYGLKHISDYGSQAGTDKTTIGIPDAFSYEEGGFVLIAHTTNQSDTVNKIKGDIEDCLTKAGILDQEIQKIICCHTNFRLCPNDYRKLQAIDSRVEVIPPSQIAHDLVGKYPLLAHEFFGMDLGSGAFKTRAEYLNAQEQRRYATSQSQNIMYRDKDIENLVNCLANGTRAVIVTGPSGCGKTKLALDACNKFCEGRARNLLILESRNASHADADIDTVIKEADNLVILVDDANQQTTLDHLLDTVASKDSIAVVSTVRSSSFRELKTRIDQHLTVKTLSLQPLDEDRISSIIRDQYGITNHFAIDRITSVAHGNLRLAIMAASALHNGDSSSLISPYDMLSAYIEPQLERYSHDTILALEAFAVWGVCDISPTDEACEYLASKGIEIAKARRYAIELNDDEIIDVLNNVEGGLAVRFQEQNLRDFLVYKAFLIDRAFNLTPFIVENILNNRDRVMRVIKVLLDVFSDANTVEAVRTAAQAALNNAEGDFKLTQALMSDFHAFYGAKALTYARNRIEIQPCKDISKELSEGNSSSDGSVTLRILAAAMRVPSYSKTAIELIVECVSKGSETPDEYRWFFSRNNALTPLSLQEDFKQEMLLLDSLGDAYASKKSSNIARCLLMLVITLLQGNGETIESTDSGSIQIRYFQMPCCSQRAKLDFECFKALHPMLEDEVFSKEVRSVFKHHFGWYGDCFPDPDRAEMLGEEINLFGDILSDFVAGAGLDGYCCCLQLNELCAKTGIRPIDVKPIFDECVIDAWSLYSNSEEIESTIRDWSLERIASACEVIAVIPDDSDLVWDSQQIVPKVISFLTNSDSSLGCCCYVLHRYLKKCSEVGSSYCPRGLFDPLINKFGYQAIRSDIESPSLGIIKSVAIDIIDCIGVLNYPEEVDHKKLLKTLEDGKLHLDFLTASKIADSEDGFLYEYTTSSLKSIREHPWLINGFFCPVADDEKDQFLRLLASTFAGKEKELADWYTLFLKERHFDYDGTIALLLFEKYESFASDYISALSESHLIRQDDAAERIRRMWSENYAEMPSIISQLLIQFYSREGIYGNPIAAFLPIRSLRVGVMQSCWDWLFRYIDEMAGDRRRMQDVAEAFGDAGDSERLAVLNRILTADVDGNLIRNIWLDRTSMSGSVREGFMQAYRREADFFRRLSDSLPDTSTYLPHKAWLEQYVLSKEGMARDELWKAFHEV